MFKNIPRPYPGRIIAIGKDGDFYVGIYAVTARSASSRAKRYVLKGDSIVVESTDETVMAQGNIELLLYTAMRFDQNAIIIGNGRQIDELDSLGKNATDSLTTGLQYVEAEPDKYLTPRITGCIQNTGTVTGALHIVRAKESGLSRDAYNIVFSENTGFVICTYSGSNIRPTPSYDGDPFKISLDFGNAQSAAQALYTSLAPDNDEEDLRVSVVVVYWNRLHRDISIVNAVDLL